MTPVTRTVIAPLIAAADVAGAAAAQEQPRPLTPMEKAAIIRLCQHHYGSDASAVRSTIEDCEAMPGYREYLLMIDRGLMKGVGNG